MRVSKKSVFAAIVVLFTMIMSGCASKPRPPYEIKSPEKGMIYGNIQIPGREVTEIELLEYDKLYIPPFINPPRVMIFRNGNFVAENLEPGDYYISRFVSNKLFYTLVKDSRSAYQHVIRVEPGSVNFVGSFKITDVEPGVFTKGKFKYKQVRFPSERKVLKHMYDVTQGTGWQARIHQRIKSLR